MEVKDGACMDVCPVDCIYEPPCSAHPTYSFSLKNIYEQQIVHKYVWGDLATRGRVRIFTALNKNKGYERIR
jgi:hypothetical protein